MSIPFEPYFEVRFRADQNRWEVMVTWGHALRHVVEGLSFRSEHTALRWIEEQSSLWMEVQNRGPLKRAVRKIPKLVERRRNQGTQYVHQEYSTELPHSFQRSGT